MRVLTLLAGMLIGAGGMIWFYSNGSEINVHSHPCVTRPGPAADTRRAGGGAAGRRRDRANRGMVIGDITEGAPPSARGPAPTNDPPPPAKPDDSSLIVIKWPLGGSVTKFP